MVRRARRELAGGRRRNVREFPTLAALRQALARFASLRKVALRTTPAAVSFGGVPLTALADLAHALRTARLPAPSSQARRSPRPERRTR